MPDYKRMYYQLFNRVTDAVKLLELAQQDSEESFLSEKDIAPLLLPEQEKQA